MYDRDLLRIVRQSPAGSEGLELLEGIEENGFVTSGLVLDPTTGNTYPVKDGYLDLLGRRTGAHNVVNLANYPPGAGPVYEPLWRTRSLTLLTGEEFPNDREVEVIAGLARVDRGGLYLDLGCSAGLYARSLAAKLGDRGKVLGVDIAPTMLKEAVRRAKRTGTFPSFARADAEDLPFTDGAFAGAVCGGTLNEFGNPARVLRETNRVLRPGGRVVIMGILRAKTRYGRMLQHLLSMGGLRFFEPEELTSLLGHAGFEPDPLQVHNVVFFAGATRL